MLHEPVTSDDEKEDDDNEEPNNLTPDEWNQRDKATMVVAHYHHSCWEYGSSLIHLNQVFPNPSKLKDVVAHSTVMSHREVRVSNSSPVKCEVEN